MVKNLIDESETFSVRTLEPYAPSWSADGRWIAFDSGGGNETDIAQMPADGCPAEKLASSSQTDWLSTYSPDGKYLCYVSNRSGQFDLWSRDLRTKGEIRLTDTPEMESRGC